MQNKLIALSIFAATTGVVTVYPAIHSAMAVTAQPQPVVQPPVTGRARIDVVFVLDTTGSMGGLIHAAKEKIWSIASTMGSAEQTPEIRVGLVAYRDRGDAYVTRTVDLSEDLDSVYATLMDYRAEGGGDDPESVNQALYDAVHAMSWGQGSGVYKTIFLVGDAPPHMDYRNDVKYPETLVDAKKRGIVVNAIQAGSSAHTRRDWQRIAQLGNGSYFQVQQAGNAVAVDSPFDKELAELSEALDRTRLHYGDAKQKERHQRKVEAAAKLHRESSASSLARRATFNASGSGEANLIGDGDLVEDVTSGRVDLTTVEPSVLPEPMQVMAPGARQELVEETAKQRTELKAKIRDLADQRARFIEDEVNKAGGAEETLDHKIFRAVREQAASAGLSYQGKRVDY